MTVKISNQQAPRPDDVWDRTECAKYIRVSGRTLDRWHRLKLGPPRVKIGNRIRYRVRSVIEWLAANESGGQASK
jgi:predicted DNA-binding transcriptional regulator AlpA